MQNGFKTLEMHTTELRISGHSATFWDFISQVVLEDHQ